MAKPSASPAPASPGTLVEDARRWARPLQEELGSGFVSLYLYGSSLDGSFRPGKSDLNLLLVTKPLSGSSLRALGKAWPGDRAGSNPVNLVLLNEDQVARAQDAFALELTEIRVRGKLLEGADVLSGSGAPAEALRLHVERELRVLGVRLRRVYLGARGDGRVLAATLAGVSGSLLACARGLIQLVGGDGSTPQSALSHIASWAGVEARPWLEVWRMRRESEPPDAIETLYVDFLDACDRLLTRVDNLDTTGAAPSIVPSPHA